MYGIIFRIVNSEEIARDVMQEAFVKIWNKGETYDVSKGRLFTWMLNITRNLAIDTIRSKDFKNNHQIQNIDDSVNRVNRQMNTTTKVDHIGLKEVVETLKEEYKELIDLLYFGGYTQEEAAKKLNLPLGTVKTRARSAINQLRSLLKVSI